MQANLQPDVLRINDLADYLRVSKSTARRYLKKGLIPYSKIGKIVYIRRKDALFFVESAKINIPIEKKSGEVIENRENICYNSQQICIRPDKKRG